MRTVPGNPKDSKWRSTPQDARNRKIVAITLSDEARERLKALAKARGTHMSTVVEALIMEAALTPEG